MHFQILLTTKCEEKVYKRKSATTRNDIGSDSDNAGPELANAIIKGHDLQVLCCATITSKIRK